MYGIYQVFGNESLDQIAEEVGITKEELKKLNGIVGDVMLRPGSFLIVPKYDTNYEKYTVQKGDNMYAIAKKYGVSYPSLLKLNGLDEGDYIYPNEVILIPKQGNVYITEEETIEDISTKIGKPISEIIMKNPQIVVEEDQVIYY
jgi:LysM repeat protein